MKRLAILLLLNICLCAFAETTSSSDTPATERITDKPLPRIEWDHSTISLIHSNSGYARIIRLKDGRLLCGYDFRGQIWVRHSSDEGKSWQEPVHVAKWPHGFLTNTELLQMQDGSLLCMYNERPHRRRADTPPTNESHPYSISVARSEDGGKTWEQPQRIYSAGHEFENGCWEPAAVQLPSGEVQLF
ncbi:MAG: sialidase family protein, partial [Limisphaerales bacterium]